MERYRNNIQDQFGNAIGSVTVTVRLESTGAVASIFSDNSGTGKANPFTNDADGEFFFYAADDRYDIFFTGPITDQIDDVLLQDSGAFGPTLDILADINTATPPTTEGPIAKIRFVDLSVTDELGRIGFDSIVNAEMRISNYMHGGAFRITGQNAAGLTKSLFLGDPDSTSSMFYAGLERIVATSSGQMLLRSDGSTDGETRAIQLVHANSTIRARIGHISGSTLLLRNEIHGANVRLEAEDNSGNLRTLFSGDPDGTVLIYYPGSNSIRLSTEATGIVRLRSDGNTDTENRLLSFTHSDATQRGWVGYLGNDTLQLRNESHGGSVQIVGEDVAGTIRTILTADPDATTVLRADTDLRLEVAAGELAILCSVNAAVNLYYNNANKFRTTLQTNADQISGAEVVDGEGIFTPVGLGVVKETTNSSTGVRNFFTQAKAGQTIYSTASGATQLDTFASTGSSQTNIPPGTMWFVQVNGAGVHLIRGGTGVTIRYWSGAGAPPADVDVTVARGGVATVRKVSDSIYDVWGIGLS